MCVLVCVSQLSICVLVFDCREAVCWRLAVSMCDRCSVNTTLIPADMQRASSLSLIYIEHYTLTPRFTHLNASVDSQNQTHQQGLRDNSDSNRCFFTQSLVLFSNLFPGHKHFFQHYTTLHFVCSWVTSQYSIPENIIETSTNIQRTKEWEWECKIIYTKVEL